MYPPGTLVRDTTGADVVATDELEVDNEDDVDKLDDEDRDGRPYVSGAAAVSVNVALDAVAASVPVVDTADAVDEVEVEGGSV